MAACVIAVRGTHRHLPPLFRVPGPPGRDSLVRLHRRPDPLLFGNRSAAGGAEISCGGAWCGDGRGIRPWPCRDAVSAGLATARRTSRVARWPGLARWSDRLPRLSTGIVLIVGLGITLQAGLMPGSGRKASQSDSLSPRVARTAREGREPEDRLSNLPRPRRSVRLPESAGEGQGGAIQSVGNPARNRRGMIGVGSGINRLLKKP